MRVFVKSFGCSSNLADGEVLAGCLAEAGYELVNSVSTADLVVYNTCAVKGPTENRIIEIAKRVPKAKKLIVAGCLPLINFERLCDEVHFNGVIGPAAGDKIVEVLKRVLNGEKIVALKGATEAKPSLDLPRLRFSPVISIVPINYGCLGSCAFCCVALARGRLRSHGLQEIIERVKNDLANGSREFWLTSQDTGSYGRDIGETLPKLLDALCGIDGDFKIRVGMMTPNTVSDVLEDLVEVFKSEKILKFVHLPVQSGDDQILKLMRRFYSVNDLKRIVGALRTSFPEITLATDVICGFPGESKEAFDGTLRLIEEVRPEIVNVSKYFSRPKTLAAEMHKNLVPLSEIRRRSSLTAAVAKKVSLSRNQRWIGWTGEILVDEVGKVSGSWVGRNFAYKPIAVQSSDDLFGKTLRIRIVGAFPTYLQGTVVQ